MFIQKKLLIIGDNMKYLISLLFLVSCSPGTTQYNTPSPEPSVEPILEFNSEENIEVVIVNYCKTLPVASLVPELPDLKKKERNKCVQKCLKQKNREDD